jgi:prolyl 4-hydroxylase
MLKHFYRGQEFQPRILARSLGAQDTSLLCSFFRALHSTSDSESCRDALTSPDLVAIYPPRSSLSSTPSMRYSTLYPLVPLFLHSTHARDPPSQQPLSTRLNCPSHTYQIHLISQSPLIIYIPSFLTASETAHLSTLPTTNFTRSHVADGTGDQRSASTRTSSSASLSLRDDVIRCIEERARTFQSPSLPRSHLEPLQLVKYGVGEAYDEHTDWFTNPAQTGPEVGGNRVSSFFVYVKVSEDIVGGGTRFPGVDAPGTPAEEALGSGFFGAGLEGGGQEWCEYVDCDEPWENGLTVRPVQGSAVFWANLLPGGRGDERTLHAGLPVLRGEKIGMNIWTRQGPLEWEYRGDD